MVKYLAIQYFAMENMVAQGLKQTLIGLGNLRKLTSSLHPGQAKENRQVPVFFY